MKKEAKNIIFLPANKVGKDVHIVKEVEYVDGNYKDNIKIIEDFKRPFWVTKDIYRNHKDKKESEVLNRLNVFLSTESDLYNNISKRLGQRYIGITDPRRLKESPFLYGVDINSSTILRYKYNKDINVSPNRPGFFDIEVNTLNDDIIIVSIISNTGLKLALLKSFVDKIPNLENRIKDMYDKYIPDCKTKEIMRDKLDIKVFDDEISLLKWIFYHANRMDIDILAAWNIKYDLSTILDKLESKGVDPVDVFHYDKIPNEFKYFDVKYGRNKKITEAGREMNIAPEEQWHVITSTTNYKMLDAMSAHRYIRVGGATVPGGYSLDNILEYEKVAKKLKFESNTGHKGLEWHIYMVANKPLEYIIYNLWDTMSLLEMEHKTNDLALSISLLSVFSSFDIFNSGPRRIVDDMFFFYLKNKRVLGVRSPSAENDKILGLDNWIITLDANLITNKGYNIIEEHKDLETYIRLYASDIDVTSAYPNATRAANVSKDTTYREIVKIDGIDKETFKKQNINMMFGATNAIQYCRTMFNMPSIYELYEKI